MIFHFYSQEDIQPDITDRHGYVIDLPLVATSIETRVGRLPMVTLTLRARYVELVTCNALGLPEVRFKDQDLVQILSVCKVRYVAGIDPGDSTIELDIELSPEDIATYE